MGSGESDRDSQSTAPSTAAKEHGSSILGASFNFTNSIIGAGIVGLPSAINAAGFVAGLFLCLLVSVLTDITIRLLVKVGLAHGIESYEDLCSLAFGKKGYYVLLFFQFTFAYGAMCAYLLIVKEATSNVLLAWTDFSKTAPILVDPRFLVSIFAFVFILPICMYRDFSRLAKFSALSLASVLFMVFAVVYGYIEKEPAQSSLTYDERYLSIHSNFVPALGTISFAFVCHHQTFLVFRSLKRQTMSTFKKVTRLSVFFALMTSLVMAVFGYLSFFENTKGNIFDSFVQSSVAHSAVINIARFLLAVTMVLTYPMELVVCRYTVEVFIDSLKQGNTASSPLLDSTGDVELLEHHDAAALLPAPKSGPLPRAPVPIPLRTPRNLEQSYFHEGTPSPSPSPSYVSPSYTLAPGAKTSKKTSEDDDRFQFLDDSEGSWVESHAQSPLSHQSSFSPKEVETVEPMAALASDTKSTDHSEAKPLRQDSTTMFRVEDDLYLADPDGDSVVSATLTGWDALARRDAAPGARPIRPGKRSYGSIDAFGFGGLVTDRRQLRVRSAMLPMRRRAASQPSVSGILRASGVLPLPTASYDKCRHVWLTLVLWGSTLGIAAAVSTLDTVLEITGSFSAVFLAFILPAAARIKLGLQQHQRPKYCSWRIAPVWALLVFGGVAFVSGTGLSVYDAFTK